MKQETKQSIYGFPIQHNCLPTGNDGQILQYTDYKKNNALIEAAYE